MRIQNSRSVTVEQVEIDVPAEGDYWNFMFNALAAYPIRGSTQAIRRRS